MSTKFSVRPAPRKRPWICKRSPPCLKPPIIPPTLMCSFCIHKTSPSPQSSVFSGTFLLHWAGPTRYYAGTFVQTPWFFTVDYYWDEPAHLAQAICNTNLELYIDQFTFRQITIPTWPDMAYHVFNAQTINYTWTSEIEITG